MPDLTYGALLRQAAKKLTEALGGADDRQAEASILLQHASGLDRSALIIRADEMVPADIGSAFDKMMAQRLGGMPVYRIIGRREFHGLDMALSKDTLEPRDDTEVLVELVLAQISDRNANLHFADLGTGTGAIALALLADLPKASCVATDISEGALMTAQENAEANGFSAGFHIGHGSWCEPLGDARFDFLVSNPPYIASSVVDGLAPEVLEHDPRIALDGGHDGLDAYSALLATCGEHLQPDGFLALEIGYDQRETVTQLARVHGWSLIDERRDLGMRDRALAFAKERKT